MRSGPHVPTLLVGLLVPALVSLCWLVGPVEQLSVALLVFLAAAVILEILAIPLPGYGLFSAAFPVYLAMGLQPSGGGAAALTMAGLTFARGRLRDLGELPGRLRGVLLDLGAGLLGLTIALVIQDANRLPILAGILGGAIWLGFHEGLALGLAEPLDAKEYNEWRPIYARLRGPRVGLALTALVLVEVAAVKPWVTLTLLPLLWTTHLTAYNTVHRTYVEEVDHVREQLDDSQQKLDRALGRAERTNQQLKLSQDERVLLEEYPKALGSTPSLERVIDVTVALARRIGRAEHVVLFSLDEGELMPVAHHGGHRNLVEEARLGGKREPVVDQARAEGRWQTAFLQKVPGRLFPGDEMVAAFPMGDDVLYLGRARQEFSEHELRLLALLAGHASLALESARRYRAERQALDQHAQVNRALSGWVDRLESLMNWAVTTAGTLDQSAISEYLEQSLCSVIPHQDGMLLRYGDKWSVTRVWPEAIYDLGAVIELAESVLAGGRCLLLDDVNRSRFSRPFPDTVSLLAAPLTSESGPIGAILLGAPEADHYNRQHHDLLVLISSHASVAYSNALHVEAIIEARQRLEESQAQLIQSGKMAAVGVLAAGVAHELNTPLGAIQLAVTAAAEQLEEKPQAALRKLETADKAAQRARDIIDKLLVFSRRSDQVEETVDLEEVVRSTLDLAELKLARDGVKLDVYTQPGLNLLGDGNEIQQVLLNLVLNARDAVLACDQGQRRIVITTQSTGDEVVLTVNDTGVGMTPEQTARIFEPFFTTKPLGQGTGLGLAVSHQIVAKHRGRFEVQSRPGSGSAFSVFFPAA
ncbi:MAG: ATP-binding protein [Vulcanimicrobiota bacterium]